MRSSASPCTAFQEQTRLASGPPDEVAVLVRRAQQRHPDRRVLVFDDGTGREIDFDLRGTETEIAARLTDRRAPGRPRLGVTAREVTLLPRQWEWLNAQPGGASVTLRRLVDAARKAAPEATRAKAAREAADRFMRSIAGDAPGYEEAARALYAGDRSRFTAEIADWPADIRDHASRLAAPGLSGD